MGTLYIVATPIGNLEDISLRALRTLFEVDVVACEDTRRTGLMLDEFKKRYGGLLQMRNASPRLLSYYEEIEDKRAPEILALLEEDKSVALVSDAGTPLLSDPGYVLVSEALKRGVAVRSVPGPAAAESALSVSGLPANAYLFLGFPPEKQAGRIKVIETMTSVSKLLSLTFIFYCAPHKLEEFLLDMKTGLGDKQIVVCRELTKQFEETWRGTISAALANQHKFKGELVVLVRVEQS
jgi:16S rRNA (cytidine1402-2'-O)-methyltransferase